MCVCLCVCVWVCLSLSVCLSVCVLKVLSHEFLSGHKSLAGSRLFAILLGSCLLSTALCSSCLLWLWSLHLTGPLCKFYFTSWKAKGAEKLPWGLVTKAREDKRTKEPLWEGSPATEGIQSAEEDGSALWYKGELGMNFKVIFQGLLLEKKILGHVLGVLQGCKNVFWTKKIFGSELLNYD